jgi:hypothetical protein
VFPTRELVKKMEFYDAIEYSCQKVSAYFSEMPAKTSEDGPPGGDTFLPLLVT